MNITILGPGAIGSLWAYNLQKAGHTVSVISRSKDKHYSISLDNHPSLSLPNNDMASLRHCDLVIVTTKAWQVTDALAPLLPHLTHETIILLMHNGMGVIEEIEPQVSEFPLLIATTTHGALKRTPNHVQHTGLGLTQIGARNSTGSQCGFLVEVLQHALPNVTWNPKIDNALWLKLAINCAINPLTAIEQCKNGLLSEKRFASKLLNITKEIVTVANAEGRSFDTGTLYSQIEAVIEATAENHSSMHQDIYNKRKTEIDYISGYLIRCADKHGIDVPENRALYQTIKEME